MKIAKMIVAAAVLVAAAAPAAHAGTKYMISAPAIRSAPGPQTIYCDILNLNTSAKDVTIDVMDYAGAVVATSGSFSLLPNNGYYQNDSTGVGAYCRFTVNGSTKKYRAIAIYDDTSTYTVAIPAY